MTHYEDAINAVNGLNNDLTDAEQALKVVKVTVADQADEITRLKGVIVGLQGDNTALKADLADCKAHLPKTTLWGANVGGYGATKGESATNAFSRILAGFGEINLVRYWPNGVFAWGPNYPPSYYGDRAIAANLGSDVAGANAGRYDDDLRMLAGTATRRTLLTFAHEPEDDRAAGAFTVPQWQQAQMRFARIVKEAGNDLVSYGPLMMGVTYHKTRYVSAAAGNVPAAEWMNFNMVDVDFLGADLYQWGKDDASADHASVQFDPFLALCAEKGKAAFVGELGTRRPNPPFNPGISTAKRVEYLEEAIAIVDASTVPVLGVCYYETDRGAADKVPWNLLPPPGQPQTSPPATVWAQVSTR